MYYKHLRSNLTLQMKHYRHFIKEPVLKSTDCFLYFSQLNQKELHFFLPYTFHLNLHISVFLFPYNVQSKIIQSLQCVQLPFCLSWIKGQEKNRRFYCLAKDHGILMVTCVQIMIQESLSDTLLYKILILILSVIKTDARL